MYHERAELIDRGKRGRLDIRRVSCRSGKACLQTAVLHLF